MAIVTRPSNVNCWLTDRVAALDGLLAAQGEAANRVQANLDAGERMLRDFLRYGGIAAEVAADLDGLGYLARSLERRLPFDRVRRALDDTRAHGPDFLRFAACALEQCDPVQDRHRATLAALDAAPEGAVFYGYDPDDPATQDDEYRAAMGLLDGLRRLRAVIAHGEPLLAEIGTKVQVMRDIRAAASWGQQWRPPHDAVETLWHASAFAAEIARDGFLDRRPDERCGLGSLGRLDTISFTHDRDLAENLARSLREFWLIAHGQLTAPEIVAWIRAERIDERSNVASVIGLGKPLDALGGPRETARLYWAYLGLTTERENPFFMDVDGVLAAVRLEPGDEYLIGESEFRVMPERVLAVRRLAAPDTAGPEPAAEADEALGAGGPRPR